MRIGHWHFLPGLWPSIATITLFPILVSLGLWQLDRAAQKREMHADFLAHQSSAVVDLNRDKVIRNNKTEMIWRRVKATGYFLEDLQILLDNQVMNSQAGYFVYTPLQLVDENDLILVNRGWIPVGYDRNQLPALVKTEGVVTVSGVAKNVPVVGITLGKSIPEQIAPGIYRLLQLDLDQVSELVGKKVMSYIVRLDPGSAHGYVRQWNKPGTGEDKHLGYAFQWFAFAVTLLVIYFLVNLKKEREEQDGQQE